jgi:hypothetical protein
LLVALLVSGGLYYRSHQQSKRLTDEDTIVLADFANTTGDAIFDDTLKTALTASLRQSPSFRRQGRRNSQADDPPSQHPAHARRHT